MTQDELNAVPRKTVAELLVAVPGGPGYDARVILAVEEAINLEWWRGFHACRVAAGLPEGKR